MGTAAGPGGPATAGAIDRLLAATALAHGLTLVTRNLGDFEHPDLTVADPWAAA